ncbi:MAG: hypothetical protein RLZZ271_842 [Pseudomonadota bacterium]|jgi:hypothetical protein
MFERWSGQRRICVLGWLKWSLPLLLVWVQFLFSPRTPASWVPLVIVALMLSVSLHAWQASSRRQFIRECQLPALLGIKLRKKYEHLSGADVDLVLRGLKQFFLAYARSGHRFVAMPSQVADDAWHDFILHTRAYESWCKLAFGRILHHSPAEVLGSDPRRNSGLRRTWFWACKEEGIRPGAPTRLPLLFALDTKLNIPNGFKYLPDCKNIDQQSGSDVYCGNELGGASGCAGGGEGGADSGGDGGGCGGGCGGGD